MKQDKSNYADPRPMNLIGLNTELIGDLKTTGDIRLEGYIKGTVTIGGRLVIGESGKIEGDVFSQDAEIFGQVLGSIKITELLTLRANAVVKGEISTNKLAIEPGAVFTGDCKMGNVETPYGQTKTTDE